MPALGAVDPADLRAQARAELGLSRELAQPRRVKPHPREGGSSGYPVWSREEQLEKWNAGEENVASEASLYHADTTGQVKRPTNHTTPLTTDRINGDPSHVQAMRGVIDNLTKEGRECGRQNSAEDADVGQQRRRPPPVHPAR